MIHDVHRLFLSSIECTNVKMRRQRIIGKVKTWVETEWEITSCSQVGVDMLLAPKQSLLSYPTCFPGP